MAQYLVPPLGTKRARYINANFFLSNNTDIMDAVASYAEAICIQDKALDDSPQAWLAAGHLCADSYRDDQMLVSSNDGMWKKYSLLAYHDIVAMCVGRADELCKWFK